VKSTGIVRNIDDQGRLVIPIELRRTLGTKACAVTGAVNPENRVYGGGAIVLSPEGAKMLKDELQNQL
jgi:AbrB family transcriptional regulator, transcriptional pleiotropic regulator of transition state genes